MLNFLNTYSCPHCINPMLRAYFFSMLVKSSLLVTAELLELSVIKSILAAPQKWLLEDYGMKMTSRHRLKSTQASVNILDGVCKVTFVLGLRAWQKNL